MIRVLFQPESPNSEHQNSSYVQNNSDYSLIKTDIRIWLAHGPTLNEFLSYLEQEFDNIYLYMDGYSLKSILIGHLNHSNRIRNMQVMAFYAN